MLGFFPLGLNTTSLAGLHGAFFIWLLYAGVQCLSCVLGMLWYSQNLLHRILHSVQVYVIA